jgi:3'-5' exoribonuclease
VKGKYISDLAAGTELLNEPFLLQDVNRRKTKDGRQFLLVTLRDKTGQLSSVFWDVPDYIDAWARSGLIALVTGRASLYKDSLQVYITDLNQSHAADLADFLPASSRPRSEMLEELRQHAVTLADPWQTLVTYLLLEEPFQSQFASAPAARSMHHGYIGGLLEHSLSMATLARHLAGHYPHVDGDLLVSGALLHDMGKALEYSLEDGFSHSDDGRLVGHIIRGIVMVEKAAAELDFPEARLRQLIHLIASHHGTYEWGSPVVPKTLEAILLHQIDLLDSRVQGFFDHVRNDGGPGHWTTKRSEMFNTELQRPTNTTQ